MKLSISTLGSLAVAAVFSFSAVAAVGTRTAPRAEEAVRPGATVEIRPNAQTQRLQNKFDQAAQKQGASVAPVAQNVCSIEQLASKLIADTRISYADALAGLKFWGSRITIGTCNASSEGLIGYNAQARENFLEAAIEGMNRLNGKKDYSAETAVKIWADALATAKNNDGGEKTTAQAELATVDALQKNCNILHFN